MIIKTCDRNRLHLGISEGDAAVIALGRSFCIYRNPIAKLVTKIFHKSMTIDIDGKKYCVNRASFSKHLQSIGQENDSIEIPNRDYSAYIAKNRKSLKLNNEMFGLNFSERKKQVLFSKLIKELGRLNVDRAKKMILKGAPLDRTLYFKLLSGKKGANVNSCKFNSFVSYCAGTPLAVALKLGLHETAQFMSKVHGGPFSTDTCHKFTPENHGFYYTINEEYAQKVVNENGELKLVNVK